jgi:hypothetical protein
MNTKIIKYEGIDYSIDLTTVEPFLATKVIIRLPSGDLLHLEPETYTYEKFCITEPIVIEAAKVDTVELTFQRLLSEYNLTDNRKTRKLWAKCYDLGHSYGLEGMETYFHDLVNLILED